MLRSYKSMAAVMCSPSIRIATRGILPAIAFCLTSSVAVNRSAGGAELAKDVVANSANLANANVSCESLVVYPQRIEFPYLSDSQRFLIQAVYTDGSTLDVTELAEVQFADSAIATLEDGRIVPRQSGNTAATINYAGLSENLEITIAPNAAERPIRFRNDLLAHLTRSGCNTGKCHGAASGKDGFRLSLFGYDPVGDHYRLTRELNGRRVNLADPENCLLVNKATGEVPHTGGGLIAQGSTAYRKIVAWLAEGAPADPSETPVPTGITVYPTKAVMSKPGLSQQITVYASYSDGTVRDVTDLSVFFSNNDAASTVTENGSAQSTGPGTAFIMARFDEFTGGSALIVRPGTQYEPPAFEPTNEIDQKVFSRWLDLHIKPSEICNDEIFVRRVYLDTIGLLPTAEQTQRFVADVADDKRERLIDELLARDAFLDMWTMKLADLLLIRRANGLSQKGLSRYDAWLREKVKSGVTIDKIVRELIPASGSTFENPPTSYYQTETTPQLIAENIAQSFLGMRLQCAQCHNHPFDRWTMDDYYGFTSFVSRVGYKQAKDPREITVYDAGEGSLEHPVPGREVRPKFLGGDFPQIQPGTDYRQVLADWITSPENTAFSQNLANLLWEQFLGVGIITPVDDVRVSNPPSNPDLLRLLGEKLVAYEFDVRKLARDILNSKAYQLSTQANEWNVWDQRDFSHAQIRRVRAEVLLDCISQVTRTTDRLSGLPLGGRAIEIPDGPSNNYFLETFGRSDRATACSCEVSTAPTLSQALHLLNGETTSGKIEEGGVIDRLIGEGKSPAEIAEMIYESCYSRKPTTIEMAKMSDVFGASKDVRQELVDMFWAVLNSNEFIFNH